MKLFSTLALAFALGLSLVSLDAEAKRLGGSRSIGMQRTAPTTPATPVATPASTAAAGAAATAPRRSWMGPIAGIAAGLGLAALASYLGFGEEFATMLLIGLAVVAVMAVIGFMARKRAAQSSPLAYAGAGNAGQGMHRTSAHEMQMPPSGAASGGSMIGSGLAQPAIPADFDVAGFVRNAKVQFIRLQAANDAGNLDDIRQFTTPEMFAEIKMDVVDRGDAGQVTEVVRVDADVIEVAEEAQRYVVSVRFTGEIRESQGGPVEAFNEIWHLEKPRAGSGGWLLAGIQQAH